MTQSAADLPLDRSQADAQYQVGLNNLVQGELDEAIACFRQVLRARPDMAAAHGNLGAALQLQGKLQEAVAEISYHATSGTKHPPPGSLLEECTGQAAGIDAFDASGRIGLLHMAFPLKMMLQPDGHLTSCDILHTVAGAILFQLGASDLLRRRGGDGGQAPFLRAKEDQHAADDQQNDGESI